MIEFALRYTGKGRPPTAEQETQAKTYCGGEDRRKSGVSFRKGFVSASSSVGRREEDVSRAYHEYFYNWL